MTGLPVLPIRRFAACLAVVTLLLALPLSAGELYQWKDAQGVTHYSDAPPPSGSYQNRRITNAGAGVASEDSAVAPAESSQCTTARANLALLEGDGPVSMGSAEDGAEPVPMGADQRAAQKQLAEAAIKAYCPGPEAG